MTSKKLQKIMRKWKKILRLNMWDISISFERQSNFSSDSLDTAVGEINYLIESGSAIIKILDPVDWPDSPFDNDIEKVVVHELLHLHFAVFEPKGKVKRANWELIIETLAKTMVDLRRKKRGGALN